jgi:hypothetical protein
LKFGSLQSKLIVCELGVENATFKEVLEAVKKYYEEKLSSNNLQSTVG